MNISSVFFLAHFSMLGLEVVDFLRLTPMQRNRLWVHCQPSMSILLTASRYCFIKDLAVDIVTVMTNSYDKHVR